jgi:hypothetical protein
MLQRLQVLLPNTFFSFAQSGLICDSGENEDVTTLLQQQPSIRPLRAKTGECISFIGSAEELRRRALSRSPVANVIYATRAINTAPK